MNYSLCRFNYFTSQIFNIILRVVPSFFKKDLRGIFLFFVEMIGIALIEILTLVILNK